MTSPVRSNSTRESLQTTIRSPTCAYTACSPSSALQPGGESAKTLSKRGSKPGDLRTVPCHPDPASGWSGVRQRRTIRWPGESDNHIERWNRASEKRPKVPLSTRVRSPIANALLSRLSGGRPTSHLGPALPTVRRRTADAGALATPHATYFEDEPEAHLVEGRSSSPRAREARRRRAGQARRTVAHRRSEPPCSLNAFDVPGLTPWATESVPVSCRYRPSSPTRSEQATPNGGNGTPGTAWQVRRTPVLLWAQCARRPMRPATGWVVRFLWDPCRAPVGRFTTAKGPSPLGLALPRVQYFLKSQGSFNP